MSRAAIYREDRNFGTAGVQDYLRIVNGPWDGCPVAFQPNEYFEFTDHFFRYDDTATVGGWAEVSDGGTIATEDGAGGILSIATGAVDNNESYVSSLTEGWKFAADKPLWFGARVKLTEANTNTANIIVGLSDTVAADSLLDNGAGPMASYDGAVFYKVDGTMQWSCESSNATTQDTDASVVAYASATWYNLNFIFNPVNSTTGVITYFIDGTKEATQTITLAGLEEMHVLLGVKAGAGFAETLKVDYVRVVAAV